MKSTASKLDYFTIQNNKTLKTIRAELATGAPNVNRLQKLTNSFASDANYTHFLFTVSAKACERLYKEIQHTKFPLNAPATDINEDMVVYRRFARILTEEANKAFSKKGGRNDMFQIPNFEKFYQPEENDIIISARYNPPFKTIELNHDATVLSKSTAQDIILRVAHEMGHHFEDTLAFNKRKTALPNIFITTEFLMHTMHSLNAYIHSSIDVEAYEQQLNEQYAFLMQDHVEETLNRLSPPAP